MGLQGLQNIKILLYHSISDDCDDPYATTIENFKEQIDYIAHNGYNVISLTEALRFFNNNDIPKKSVVFTFDDGFTDFLENAARVLKKYNFKATIFIVVSKIGVISNWRMQNLNRCLMTWGQLKEIVDYGHSIGSHGLHHYDLTTLNQEELDEEISVSKDIIQGKLGVGVDSFSYPWGKCTQREQRSVKKANYSCAVGVGRYKKNIFSDNRFLLDRISIEQKDTISDFAEKLK